MRIILHNPTIKKRPVLALDKQLHLCFSTYDYSDIFS